MSLFTHISLTLAMYTTIVDLIIKILARLFKHFEKNIYNNLIIGHKPSNQYIIWLQTIIIKIDTLVIDI